MAEKASQLMTALYGSIGHNAILMAAMSEGQKQLHCPYVEHFETIQSRILDNIEPPHLWRASGFQD
jgi:hypothetical protein